MKRLIIVAFCLFAAAGAYAQLQDLCIDMPQEIPEWHPVGCEVVDCCPGCPGSTPFCALRTSLTRSLSWMTAQRIGHWRSCGIM